jgi:transcriptional regulator with GAF, ATPase, and Fis domain
VSRTDPDPVLTTDETLEQLGRLALRDPSMPTLLQQVVQLLGSTMPMGSETSISVHARGDLLCVGSGETARELDEAQFADGRGPALHAARTGATTEVADVRSDTRWPEHARRAAAEGMLSSLSIPLAMDADAASALTVYARDVDALDEERLTAVRRLAPHARSAVASSEARHRARAMADDMEADLEARAMIVRARGILVQRHGLTPERAVEVMARMSRQSQVGLRDVAAGLVRMADEGRRV